MYFNLKMSGHSRNSSRSSSGVKNGLHSPEPNEYKEYKDSV